MLLKDRPSQPIGLSQLHEVVLEPCHLPVMDLLRLEKHQPASQLTGSNRKSRLVLKEVMISPAILILNLLLLKRVILRQILVPRDHHQRVTRHPRQGMALQHMVHHNRLIPTMVNNSHHHITVHTPVGIPNLQLSH
ncbi:Uncharacterized protein Fot_20158 [Forsythia ovata]|uniref:Uncharacterized protein n=1 Tax=Forsythia ovata TaxID=205694 RepID=A0ABD1VN38_9LAMI